MSTQDVQVQITPHETFINFVTTAIHRVTGLIAGSSASISQMDYACTQLEQLSSVVYQGAYITRYIQPIVAERVGDLYRQLDDALTVDSSTPLRQETCVGTSGRPRYDIAKDDLQRFLDMNFTANEIASIFHVSKSTIDRRISQFNLRAEIPRYTDITSNDLDNVVRDILGEFPNAGIRNLKGHLRARNIRVRWEDVRLSLWRVDPVGIFNRFIQQSVIHQRRVYSVAGPLALVHIDGHHKLIRWGLVVHGGIDGYSRKIFFSKL